MRTYGDTFYLEGVDYYDKLPENFRSNTFINETFLRLDYVSFDTYSQYVGQGIMDAFGFIRQFGDPQLNVIKIIEFMVKHLETVQDENSYIKQHYIYMEIGDFYYKRRNEFGILEKAIANYERDLELMPFFAKQTRPPTYPSLKRLITIYEKQGDLNRALYLAEMGVKYKIPLSYEYEEKVDKLKKKIAKKSR